MTLFRLIRLARCRSALALVLILAAGAVHAGVEDPRDTAAVQAVTLDDALFQRYRETTGELIPAMDDQDAVMVVQDDQGRPRRAATLAAELDASPIASRILASHHMSSHQYVLVFLALINGSMQANGMPFSDSEGEHPSDRWGATRAQESFCRKHMAEIQATFPKP